MLHFDGDLRRIYEVPDNASYTVDSEGYRLYTGTGSTNISTSALFSRWTDYHNENKWATLALSKSGGAFRNFVDGGAVFATIDLRLINGWQLVPSNHAHQFGIIGNLFDDIGLNSTFDSERNTAQGIITSVAFADALQTVQVESRVDLTPVLEALAAAMEHDAESQADIRRLMKAYGMVPGATFKMPPPTGGAVIEDGEAIADVSGDCKTGFEVTGR